MSHLLARAIPAACAAALAVSPALAQTKPAAPVASSAEPASAVARATGVFPCARDSGQPMAQCRFGVVRQGGGGGRLTVSWPDGGERVIVFTAGAPTSFERVAPADADTKMSVRRDLDLYQVTIGAERFEIPDVVITGG